MTTELRRLYLSVEHDAGFTDVRIGVTEFNCVGGVRSENTPMCFSQ
jgi:hypothetical protein